MFTVSNALLMSSATMIVRSGGLFWLKHVAFEAMWCGDVVCDVRELSLLLWFCYH